MKRRSDEEISAPLYAFDAEVRSQYGCFAGVDEAGDVYKRQTLRSPRRKRPLHPARLQSLLSPRPRKRACWNASGTFSGAEL